MREWKKIYYKDRVFLVIMMLIMICSGLVMAHNRISLLKEEIFALETIWSYVDSGQETVEEAIGGIR